MVCTFIFTLVVVVVLMLNDNIYIYMLICNRCHDGVDQDVYKYHIGDGTTYSTFSHTQGIGSFLRGGCHPRLRLALTSSCVSL